MHRKAIWKPGIGEIPNVSRGIAPGPHKVGLHHPYEPPAAKANVLAYVRLCPTGIKLNPSWNSEISKNAWIKPWFDISPEILQNKEF